MTDSMTPEQVAQEASQPGTFNFIDRVVNRNYPTKDVEVYLDEKAGHKIQELLNERELVGNDVEKLERIDADLELWRKKAAESRYIFHLEGISVEEYDKTVDDSREQFPLEYRESRHPLTMELERSVVPNDDRETYFRTQLWSKYIRSVEDAQGNVDTNISPQFVGAAARALPVIALLRIQNGVEELRMTSEWMNHIQDADFFPKS